ILRGLDGTRRMGKSLGNYIGVGESAYDQFAKVMSVPDDLMKERFELLTDRAAEEIARLIDANQKHPMQAKKTLGKDIATFHHDKTRRRSPRRAFLCPNSRTARSGFAGCSSSWSLRKAITKRGGSSNKAA